MNRHIYLALDLGAESGRAILGTLENGRLSLREVHRFPNGPIARDGRLHWDAPALFDEIRTGLALGAAANGGLPECVAVDTWGVDFGLVDPAGELVGLPFAYRDLRNVEAMESFLARVPRERVYNLTGIQFLPFNSLFQLHALTLHEPGLLDRASDLLFMPDLFTYFLTGARLNESTISSTSQLIDPRTGAWNPDLIAALGIKPSLLHDPLPPGTIAGRLLPGIAAAAGLGDIPVAAVASHDTASAVAAVPARGEDWAYISSGTWSLMGVELPGPLITPRACALNFTNEGGMAGRVRFLKNIAGLWLVQQCRRAWSADGTLSYDDLAAMADEAPPFRSFVDPDSPAFLNPPDMPAAIRDRCAATGQPVPETRAATVRCILESLALKYRAVLDELREVTGRTIRRIHIIGGGSRNGALCRFAADATGLPVMAGPAEATATGNILGQALALGHLRSPEEIRETIAATFELRTFEPHPGEGWGRAYERFRALGPG
jgi:rhamnulokinase